jgi:hypothetical protein
MNNQLPPALRAPDPSPSRFRGFAKRERPSPQMTRVEREAAIAKAFVESRAHRPLIENAICGFGEPSAQQIAELMQAGEPSKHPQKRDAAMATYYAVCEGRMIVVED